MSQNAVSRRISYCRGDGVHGTRDHDAGQTALPREQRLGAGG